MFTKNDSKAIKGVAILLMLLHHLLFVNRQPGEFMLAPSISINGVNLIVLLRDYSKICVSIFSLLGGYGYFHLLNNSDNDSCLSIFLKRIKSLYISYWKVFLIFIPIGFIFFRDQGTYCVDTRFCLTFLNFDRIEFIANFWGLDATYNFEWWYLKTYLISLFVGSAFYFIFLKKSKNIFVDVFILSVITFLVLNIPQIITITQEMEMSKMFLAYFGTGANYIPLFLWGMMFSKYDLLSRICMIANDMKLTIRIVLGIVLLTCDFFLRQYYYAENGFEMEIMMVSIFIIALIIAIKPLTAIWKLLQNLGNYSTNMWLIHTFYCYYFGKISRIVYFSRNIIVDYITLFIFSYISAILLDVLWKYIGKSLKKIINVLP